MAAALSNESEWQCKRSLVECLGYLFTSGIACDVTFLIGEYNEEIKAHKTILLSRSPIFYAMFEGPLSEKGEITIPDISKDVFVIFLRYLYTDEIQLTVETATTILAVARKYFVDHLVKRCESFIRDHITPDNVFFLLEQAHIFSEDNIKTICIRSISQSPDVLKTACFLTLSSTVVKSIIESDELSIEERFVYEAAMRWAEAECDRQGLKASDSNKRTVLGEIFYTIRFPIMDEDYILRKLVMQEMLTSDELIQIQRFNQDPVNFSCEGFNTRYRKIQDPICIKRFSSCVKEEWNSIGSNDAISFTSTANAHLHGIRLYGAGYPDTIVNVGVYDADNVCIYKDTHSLCRGKYRNIQFKEILKIRRNSTYSIVVHGGVCTRLQGENGKKTVQIYDRLIIFSDCKFYESMTNSERGQIPGLLLSK